ncbi:GNAT family N-acetyltransferase [Candidatus Chloroploca sp. M-50]|uniref:GNAT family N-acetyltransferase n=1 Tax=Candidatus Chloroploca mongolica TaxID=2528176 RepID=A0ABS4D673_9CHLR|nr:GNAT family N-acetyltransferase [Candidatus Chloroploca mongolica]MBP1464933.1 GNAT family N-acetyltransferase [Candidatus Chloroploca mongolica]
MDQAFEIITVDADNVDQQGFFCYMSKRKAPGYTQKHAWLAARFAEGLTLRMVHEVGGRTVGFIEYIPGEFAWRAVYAPGYLVIHCVWVVGKGKGKGYGAQLLDMCLDDARAQHKHGVVMVASDGVWLAKKEIFLKHGFEQVGQAPPSFRLLVQRIDDGPLPTFPNDWQARQARFGAGLTVVRTPQCPYIEDATNIVLELAAEKGLHAQVVTFQTAQELQQNSPSPYGVFGIVLDGKLLSYHYLQRKDFDKLVV